MIAAAASSRGQRPSAPLPAASISSAPSLPPPLPSGAEPEAISIPAQDTEPSCDFPDHGFGAYGAWRPLPLGKVLVPPAGAIAPGGGYDLLVHFHGAEPVRKELAPLDLGLVIAAIDAGTRSGDYARALPSPAAWDDLLASIDRAVAEAAGIPAARARHIALSSWSAGYGALSQILARPARPDALILLDSLYAGYAPGRSELASGPLAPFVAMADAAARGGPLFYLTHTAVPTYGYASTGEVATFLLRAIGATAMPVTPNDGDPFRLTRMADGGNLYLRGYAGATREDHCAQLRLLPAILAERVLPAFGR